MMRFFGAALLTVVLASGAVIGTDYSLTGTNTSIKFVGTKPNGKHEGGFKKVTGTASAGADLTQLKISLEIDMDSLYSDNPKLTGHLKSPDFFGVKSNPKAKFVSTKVEKDGAEYKVTGDLTMCGETKSITFPARIAVKGGALTLTSKLKIDRTQWGMTYGKGKVDDEVALTISVNAK
jgi:polyisoprenoid-binding protein YceI